MYYRIIIFLLLIKSSPLRAQSYYFRHYQVEDGLSHNTVVCSLQDSKGFMWFGTKDGLCRFDGYAFKIFRSNPDDTKNIGRIIYDLHEDGDGILWIGSNKGLYKYDSRTERFESVTDVLKDEVTNITEDKNRNIWLISRHRLFRYSITHRKLTVFKQKNLFKATSLCVMPNGNVWVSTAAGSIHKFNHHSQQFTNHQILRQNNIPTTQWIQKIYPAGNNDILIGTIRSGAKLFNTTSFTVKDIITRNVDGTGIFVRAFVQNSFDEYWIGTESGIFVYRLSTGKCIKLNNERDNPYSLSDNVVYSLCKDREAGIWAGTYFRGLNYYSKHHSVFKKYFPKNNKNSISGNVIREICPDDNGKLWIGTEDAGLNRFNPRSEKFDHFSSGKNGHLSNSNIHGIIHYQNKLWVSNFYHGVDMLDTRSGKVLRHYTTTVDPAASDFVYYLYKSPANLLYAATIRGLYYFDQKTNRFVLHKAFPENAFYTSVLEDKQGTLWVGTYNDGLFYIRRDATAATLFTYGQYKHDLRHNRINRIFEDSQHNIWLATEEGLCHIDKNDNLKRYTMTKHLPSNVTYSILEDTNNNLWISTAKGLVWFSPKTERSKVYTQLDGLLSDQFNYNSAYKDSEGHMYFGSVKGMISFNPKDLISDISSPLLYITGFQVNNTELKIDNKHLKQSILYADTITLSYNESSFSVDFAALTYNTPQTIEYAFILKGIQKQWTKLKTNRKVYFTEVPPGNYTFIVQASNKPGVWVSRKLTIRILPPLWASNLAYVFYVIAGIAIVYYSVYSYHRKSIEKHSQLLKILGYEKEKEVYRAKIEFFTQVAHEIRTPLTLIKGPMEDIMTHVSSVPDVEENLKIMARNTDRLLSLANELLDFRKTEAVGYSLNFRKTDLSIVMCETYEWFKPMAVQRNLNFVFECPASLFAYIDKEAVNKITSNLIENAFKYTESTIIVCVNKAIETFTISIKNDGPLISYELKDKIFELFYRANPDKHQRGTGIGLALARSLALLHNGTLELKEPQDNMNIFLLTLPIRQEIEFNPVMSM